MNTMKWLLKREFWEHKGGFFWAPIVVAVIMALVSAATIIFVFTTGIEFNAIVKNGNVIHLPMEKLSESQILDGVHKAADGYIGYGGLLVVVLSFVVFFYCLSALFDERKDRSVLFWKSLPVTDSATVLSKVIVALVVAPAITIIVATILGLFLLLTFGLAALTIKHNLFGVMLTTPEFYYSPLKVVALMPVYALWALPTVGWLLMVGAWARSKPFLWAVGLPLLTGGMVSWANKMFSLGLSLDWFWLNIIGRGLLSIVPGSWFAIGETDPRLSVSMKSIETSSLLAQSWQQLATPNLWIGVAIGAAMIYAAIRLRRWKDEG
jgi:ABC-2 type transport system permease protein